MNSSICFVSLPSCSFLTAQQLSQFNGEQSCPKLASLRRRSCARICFVSARIQKGDEGFVNCERCGSDVPVAISSFRTSSMVAVRCSECGHRWRASQEQVMVLDGAANLIQAAERQSKEKPDALDTSSGVKLFVGGLSPKVTKDALKGTFGQFGEVSDAIIVNDRVTGRSRGFGFVTMQDANAAEAAIADLNESANLGARCLSVRRAQD